MKNITIDRSQENIKTYYNNLLGKHLTLREFSAIDFRDVSYYCNKNSTVRVVGCPNLHKEGGVVYIFKSNKEDVEDYTLVREIKCLDPGKFGYRINLLLDSKCKYKNVLVVTNLSESENVLSTYVYNNIFGKRINYVAIINHKAFQHVSDVKLLLKKDAFNTATLLVLSKGKNENNPNTNKNWERIKLIIKQYNIHCTHEE